MTEHRYAVAAIVGAAVLWGTTGTAAAFAPSVSALAIGAGAMGIGGILQALVNVRSFRRDLGGLSANRSLIAVGAFCVFVYPLAFYTSMRAAGVALGCTISLASAPLMSAVIERLLDKRPLSRRWVSACAFAIPGAGLICVPDAAGPSNGSTSSVLGVGLGLVAGLTYAGYARVLRVLQGRGVSRGASTGAVFGVGGMILIPVLFIAGGSALSGSWQTVMVIAYLALVPMFLGYILFGYGLAKVDTTTATTVTLIEPAVATVTAVWILGESLSHAAWLGLAALAFALSILFAPARRCRATISVRPGRPPVSGGDRVGSA